MTKDELLAISGEKYEKLQELNQIDDFYKYEKAFDTIWLEFGRQSLEKNVGEVPQNHQKKHCINPVRKNRDR